MSVSNEVKEILNSKPDELFKAVGITPKEAQEQIENRYPSLTAEAAYREWETSKYGLDGRRKGSYLMVFENDSFNFPEILHEALKGKSVSLFFRTETMSWTLTDGVNPFDFDLVELSVTEADPEKLIEEARLKWQNQ